MINYCRKFDGYQIKDENDFVVSNQEKEEALKQVDQDYIRILERTKQQITEFHKKRRTAYISLCYADCCAEIAYIIVYTYAYADELCTRLVPYIWLHRAICTP